MNNYTSFAPGVARTSKAPPSKIIFKCWVNHLKNVSLKWRVKQNICQALPPNAHIQLGLDYTKLWCGINGGSPLEELAYQSTKFQIFQEMDRQLGFQTTIPPDVLSTESTIITPLTDGEQE
jgi:hypothetical protein